MHFSTRIRAALIALAATAAMAAPTGARADSGVIAFSVVKAG